MFRHRTGSVTEELQLVPPSKLAIEDVSKTFQAATGKVLALDHVNLQVNEGEFVCLVGPSGCGKTTLLNIIAGLEKPDNGSVRADGKPVTSPGRDRLVMFQEPALFAALDVLTREQLYGDLQRIWKERKKTIVFVTHNVREAACLGERVLLFSPHPGRIQEEFIVDLPRPRDINSVDLAGYATKIIRSLRKFSEEQREDGR